MSEILAVLGRLNFLKALWLFPLAVALHEAEEWNLVRWYERNYDDLPPMTNKSARIVLVLMSSAFLLWSAVAIVTQNPKVAAWILLPAMAIVFQNALQHVYWLFYFRQYVPGAITAVLLLLPTVGYLTARAVQQNYAPIWYVMALVILNVPGLIQTVQAGNTMTSFFRAVHNVGIAIAKRL
jgi:hypothetical protein